MKSLLIAALLSAASAEAARFVVEAKYSLSAEELASHKNFKVEPFSKGVNDYFRKAYVVSGKISAEDLKKQKWVADVEPTLELEKLSLLPSEKPDRIVEDELFPYQWGLLNQGQIFYREKDDIHNLPMVGVTGKDISWRTLLPMIPAERPIVAVLDSGVDLAHPELVGNLWKNTAECSKDPKVDNDNNQLAGDCHGWNFTEAIDSEEAKNPNDIDGHGTHVAGIIAAAHNGTGIVGVAPHALIMPVKVMRDTNSKSEVASSESFARGIIYAVENGATVINMSLGWPRSLETKYLREAVYYALSKGVVIVSAAGNNNSTEPLFPCAYDGVVCAGATTLNGNFAGFTNYGGHVDTVAPGEGILSLHPIIYEPDYFPVAGFDIKSGTSQSAPFVAGLIASLRSLDKTITIDEIFARLYRSKTNPDKTKYILGGVATWDSLLKEIDSPVVRPILKRVRQLVLQPSSKESILKIPVKNFGLKSGKIKVRLEALTDSLEVVTPEAVIKSLDHTDSEELSFNVKINDLNAESMVQFRVTLTSQEGTSSYINEIPVVREIREDSKLTTIPFIFNDRTLPIGGVKGNEILSALNTVEAYVPSSRHEFYLKRVLKDGERKTLELTLFTRQGEKYVQRPRLVKIEDAVILVNFIRVDLNFDGKEDYMIQTISEKDKKQHMAFSFFNSDLQPLWGKYNNLPVIPDLYVDRMDDIRFTRRTHKVLGPIMVPTFFTDGHISKLDQVISSRVRLDTEKILRVYYLDMLEDATLQVRTITTNIWKDELKKKLKSKWNETVEVENILPVTAEDAEAGIIRAIVSVGEDSKRQIMIHKLSVDSKSEFGSKLPQLVLQTVDVDPLYSVSSDGLKTAGDVFFNVYDRTRAKIVTTKDTFQNSQLLYSHISETDILAGHLASFEKGSAKFSVLQTRDELISISTSENGERKITSRPKLRYSFLTHKLLSEMYYPVIYKRNQLQAPALYVDATSVTGNRIYVFEEQQGTLVSSIKNSILVPGNCKALNPRFSNDLGSHEFMFLCLEKNEWLIKSFSME